MARAYDVRTVALAVGAPLKWVDNLLSHHRVHGVAGGRQGLPRRVSPDGLLAIEIIWRLASELQLPVRHAAAIASRMVADSPHSASGLGLEIAGDIRVHANLASIEASLRDRLLAAMESTARPPRGRPPTRGTES